MASLWLKHAIETMKNKCGPEMCDVHTPNSIRSQKKTVNRVPDQVERVKC